MKTQPRTVWILVYPAADVAGQWVAHCLDLDVVSQGNSLEHAVMMGREAVDIVVRADVDAGLDPFDRDPAPDDEWGPFFDLMKHAVPLRSVPRERWDEISLIAAPYDVLLPEREEDAPCSDRDGALNVPDAWMIASHREQRDSGSFRSV